jgi:hypothetical protein
MDPALPAGLPVDKPPQNISIVNQVLLFINTMAFDHRCLPIPALLGASKAPLFLLFLPCDPGASTTSVRHRNYKQVHNSIQR